MFKQILGILLAFGVIAFVVLWIIGGGIGRIITASGSFSNPVTAIFSGAAVKGISFKLPNQPDFFKITAEDINASATPVVIDGQDGSASATDLPARTFGNPSPFAGKVHLSELTAQTNDPAGQYLGLSADNNNASTISLAGWSLQSAVSGARYVIPTGASTFYSGQINLLMSMTLAPGASAYIISGRSPLGVSFRENMCSAYLAKYQTFTPNITANCPNPEALFPETPENLRTYGASCLDYVRTLTDCALPTAAPVSLSPACKAFVAQAFSYNGCVNIHQADPAFSSGSWRAYLNANTTPWDPTHDIIRLLDDQGRIVDSITY